MLGEIDIECSSRKRGSKNECQLTEEHETAPEGPDPHGVPANQPGRLAPGVVSRFPYTFVFDLLLRLRPPSGSKVQESPRRLQTKSTCHGPETRRLLVCGARAVRQHHDAGSGTTGQSDRPAGKDRRKMTSVR